MKQYLINVMKWHEQHIHDFQKCTKLSDYQMMWTAFAKGVVVAWILFYIIVNFFFFKGINLFF